MKQLTIQGTLMKWAARQMAKELSQLRSELCVCGNPFCEGPHDEYMHDPEVHIDALCKLNPNM